ncbi:uncharacterized protein LOC121527638 [Cheilinus undulatus]|uniref:uncharacterized protein LOC121527638 n=1 Tax=Cheilinus undulatus TaxID=241271 RepID=UPI001BD3ED51|nr:uncharacterized protein LOC121527638 [Cheilinus undulatus]
MHQSCKCSRGPLIISDFILTADSLKRRTSSQTTLHSADDDELVRSRVKMNLSEGNATFSFSFYTLDDYHNGLTGLFSCNILIGLPANIYVVWQIARGGKGAVTSEVFALNLAVAELSFCALSLYTLLHFLLRVGGYLGYVLFYLLPQVMFTPRALFQGWICLERYMAVVHPTVFIRFRPLGYRLACCTSTWLLILLDCLINFLMISSILPFYLFISKSAFFLVLMVYCGAHALCVLKQPQPGDGERESQCGMKRKAFKIITITVGSCVVAESLKLFIMVPTAVLAYVQVYTKVMLSCLLVTIISGFVPPLLYVHRAGKLPCVKL